jgi:hypothetical protein
VLVRADKVTGIEGVRKVGYRRLKGAEASVPAKPVVQEPEKTGFDKVLDEELKSPKFKAEYDEAVEEIAAEQVAAEQVEEEVEESPSSTPTPNVSTVGTIMIDECRRLVPLDKLNWSFQERKNSGIWVNKGYFVNYAEGLRAVAGKLMDDEIRAMPNFNLAEACSRIIAAENKIVDLLKACTKAA